VITVTVTGALPPLAVCLFGARDPFEILAPTALTATPIMVLSPPVPIGLTYVTHDDTGEFLMDEDTGEQLYMEPAR